MMSPSRIQDILLVGGRGQRVNKEFKRLLMQTFSQLLAYDFRLAGHPIMQAHAV